MREAKKPISLLLSLIMVLSFFTAVPFTAGAVTTDEVSTEASSGDYEYKVLEDGTAEITKYSEGSNENVELVIPRELDGYTVKSISKSAFSSCWSLTSVTIPDSITSIGEWAFSHCKSLISITIPNSVTSIGGYVFYGTGYYNDKSNWENGVLYIDNFLIEAENRTVRGKYKVKDGTKLIADYAFSDCESVTSIIIPDSVTNISVYAFSECISLASINVESENDNYCSEDGVLFNKNKTELTKYPIGKTESTYEISNSVSSIGEWAFYGCENLTSVTIPDSVTSIGDQAFELCTRLKNITIPDSVTNISDYVFLGCDRLACITIPDSVTSIGDGAFYFCISLTSVTIPDSVTSIGYGAFINTGYYNDESNWENGVLYIDNFLVESDRDTLSGKCTVKDGTKVIADSAFSGCTSLTSVTIPDSVTSIGDDTFHNCTNLTSITIPNSVTSIGDYTFYNCESLTSITIPNCVTSIGDGVFSNCTNLESITIPDSVTSIGDEAFRECARLTSVTIPDSVTSIGNYAFFGCTSLANVIISDIVTNIESFALGYRYDNDVDHYVKIDNFKITGYTGTEAERYAKNNGFKFVSISEAPTDAPTDAPSTAVLGDADKNGVVDISDATVIQRYLAKLDVKAFSEKGADADQDGKITITDATRIQRYMAQLCNLDGSTPYIEA